MLIINSNINTYQSIYLMLAFKMTLFSKTLSDNLERFGSLVIEAYENNNKIIVFRVGVESPLNRGLFYESGA